MYLSLTYNMLLWLLRSYISYILATCLNSTGLQVCYYSELYGMYDLMAHSKT